MKQSTKKFASACMAVALSAVLLTGCTSTEYVDVPNYIPGAQTVGLTAGFALSHDAGLGDNTTEGSNIYDSDLYYLNEVRNVGADPGAMYVSVEEIQDSYDKLLAKESQLASFDATEFAKENGTKAEWVEEFGNKFYVVVTGANTSLSAETKKRYEDENPIGGYYSLYMSDDLNDWQQAGAVDGFAVLASNDEWYTSANTWAPEFKRDPLTGLYLMFFSLNTRVGSEDTEYHPTNTNITNPTADVGTKWDNMTTGIAYSEKPTGPYRFITSEDYYSYLVKLDQNGNKVTAPGGAEYNNRDVCYYRDGLGHDGEVLAAIDNMTGLCLNQNGNAVTKQTPPLNFGYYHDEIIAAYPHSTKGRGVFPAIDINPVINSKGEMYLYFSQHVSSQVKGNHVWVIKMKDWVSPDWSTLTHVTTPSISTIYNDETTEIDGVYGHYMGSSSEGSINEGTFVIEHEGWYYLSYSPFGYGSRSYAIYFAVSDNPYGPFIKVSEYSPIIGVDKIDGSDYMAGTGHHSFIQAGDEWYAIYHAFYNPTYNYNQSGDFLGRGMGVDKFTFQTYDNVTFQQLMDAQIAEDTNPSNYDQGQFGKDVIPEGCNLLTEDFVQNCFDTKNGTNYEVENAYSDIIPIPYGNGPTYSLQPLPDVSLEGEFHNVAPEATVEVIKGKADTAQYATDGMISYQKWSEGYEVLGATQMQVKLSWDSPKTIKNIMIYNSRSYNYAFESVASIVFELAEKPTWYTSSKYNGYCYIKDLKVDDYGFWKETMKIRHGCSAMATFNEIKVKSIIITINAEDKIAYESLKFDEYQQRMLSLSEIYVMGK